MVEKSDKTTDPFERLLDPDFGFADNYAEPEELLPWETGSYNGYMAERYFDDLPESKPDLDSSVLYVPGNTGTMDHADNIISGLLEAGYRGDRLFSMEPEKLSPSADDYARQLTAFIAEMRGYTDEDSFSIVAHSYGSPVALKAVHENDLYDHLEKFVSIAGPMDGTAAADAGNMSGMGFMSPDFITKRSAERGPLKQLNDESKLVENADVLTLSSQADPFFNWTMAFLGPLCYEANLDSPRIEGAENLMYNYLGHEDLRRRPGPVEEIVDFLTEV